MGQYGPVLGSFTSLASYFESTMYAGQSVRYKADKYRSPYLKQDAAAGVPDPISRWAEHHRRKGHGGSPAIATAALMTALIRGAEMDREGAIWLRRRPIWPLRSRAAGPSRKGILALNPAGHTIRLPVDVSPIDLSPEIVRPVVAKAVSKDRTQVLLEVPAMGFAWVGPETAGEQAGADPPKAGKPAREEPLAVDESGLRNEYFQVHVVAATGGIQSIQSHVVRGNRLAQQLAMRCRPNRGTSKTRTRRTTIR